MNRRIPWWLAPGRAAVSPRGLLVRAALILLAFAAVHAAGGRDRTDVLCGMTPPGGPGLRIESLTGVLYVALYLLSVVLAPILILAAGLLAWGRRSRRDTN